MKIPTNFLIYLLTYELTVSSEWSDSSFISESFCFKNFKINFLNIQSLVLFSLLLAVQIVNNLDNLFLIA